MRKTKKSLALAVAVCMIVCLCVGMSGCTGKIENNSELTYGALPAL